MGYRSDVAYTIRFTDEASYRLFIAEAKAKDLGGCFKNDTAYYDEAECDDERWCINFRANGLKWYESFADVAMHEKLIALAEDWCVTAEHKAGAEGEVLDATYRLGYIFIRIGEDSDDIQERCGGDYEWDWLQVSRQIVSDWD